MNARGAIQFGVTRLQREVARTCSLSPRLLAGHPPRHGTFRLGGEVGDADHKDGGLRYACSSPRYVLPRWPFKGRGPVSRRAVRATTFFPSSACSAFGLR